MTLNRSWKLSGWLALPSLLLAALTTPLPTAAASAIGGPVVSTPAGITPTAPVVLPLAEPQFPGDVGRTFKESDPPRFPQPPRPPKGAPNVVIIMLDDVGFGQFSTFGGATPSPTMDKLSASGLRYNRMEPTALCSPTRAALLTGRNHHSAGFGVISELTAGYDGYTGIIPRSTATVAEVLRQNGYATGWVGKNHNTPNWGAEPRRSLRSLANLAGIPVFLWLHGWQHQPVGARPVREYVRRPAIQGSQLSLERRSCRPRH
ncbi:sulfatase-like hydrolase/transferase [Cupriavidus sp. CuC1]|uniref:sulfatase-like hydrolase/transferase n=1 Tax=Cupriavidus sp. CuC1 TaxID=3373131 RepID=UPI0037CFE9E1